MSRAAALGMAVPRRLLTVFLAPGQAFNNGRGALFRGAATRCRVGFRAAAGRVRSRRRATARLSSAIRASGVTDAARAAPPAPQRKSSVKRSAVPYRPAMPTFSGAPAASLAPRHARAVLRASADPTTAPPRRLHGDHRSMATASATMDRGEALFRAREARERAAD